MKRKRVFLFLAVLPVLLIIASALLYVRSVAAQGPNLVPNPSVETVNPSNSNLPVEWTTNSWGTNTASFSYLNEGHNSSRSVKVEVTSYSDGDAKWYFTPQTISPDTLYIITDYYKSNITTRLVAMFILSNGTEQYIELDEAPASANDWAYYEDYIYSPSNAVSVSILHLVSQVGWLITDDMGVASYFDTVETPTPAPTATPTPGITPTPTPGVTPTPTPTPTPKPTTPPAPNTIANSSVETVASGDSTSPANWSRQSWGTNAPVFSYLNGQGHTGSRAIKVQMNSYTSGDAKWVFNPINVTPGETYHFSDWYKSNVTTEVVVQFTHTNNTNSYLGLRTAPASADWARYSEIFQIPAGVKNVTVLHLINRVGWLITDDYALAKYTPVPLNRPLVSLTFDDGWEDDVLTVLPVLDDYNYKATFFFATTYIENTPPTGPINVSGPAAVHAIYNAGHEIGAHSVTHPDLTTVSPTNLQYEFEHPKTYLESLVGTGNVKNFAAPFGAYNENTLNVARSLYKSHRTTDEGFNTIENFDPYRIKVQNMEVTTTLAEFQSWVDQAVQDGSWLVLVYHRVAEDNLTQYDTPLEDFEPQMEIIQNSGLSVVTYDEALDEITAQLP